MSSSVGGRLRLTIFGESHGEAIGCVLEGLPAGESVDEVAIAAQMARRAPGNDPTATKRKEPDTPVILAGVWEGRTTGAPLAMTIANTNTRSRDYEELVRKPRPGHADYPAFVRYAGFNDVRGGGHFSGRLTAPLVFAGAVCRAILRRRGVAIGGHVRRIGDVEDRAFDPAGVDAVQLDALAEQTFPLIDDSRRAVMRDAVEAARRAGDSLGGIVEAAAVGLPVGIGGPLFDGLEGRLALALFGIPAVKGVEFGDGFDLAKRRGSQSNDAFAYDPQGHVVTKTNRCGGVQGGMTNGMPLVVRAAVKPTSSIALEQDTVDLYSGHDTTLRVRGRHDPCIVPRAVPVVEAALAVTLLDAMLTDTPPVL